MKRMRCFWLERPLSAHDRATRPQMLRENQT